MLRDVSLTLLGVIALLLPFNQASAQTAPTLEIKAVNKKRSLEFTITPNQDVAGCTWTLYLLSKKKIAKRITPTVGGSTPLFNGNASNEGLSFTLNPEKDLKKSKKDKKRLKSLFGRVRQVCDSERTISAIAKVKVKTKKSRKAVNVSQWLSQLQRPASAAVVTLKQAYEFIDGQEISAARSILGSIDNVVSDRMYFSERRGVIKSFSLSEGESSLQTVLDIQDLVGYAPADGAETGGAGLMDFYLLTTNTFSDDRYLIVSYHRATDRTLIISRFELSKGELKTANKNDEDVLLEVDAVASSLSHRNSALFNIDENGYLLIAIGDGGNEANGQDLSTVNGKVLRIDVRPGRELAPLSYGIPSDNPYFGIARYREEIYAVGFREPASLSYNDYSVEYWISDRGEDQMDEINFLRIDKNYGWSITEGTACNDRSESCETTELQEPNITHLHTDVIKSSIVGGYQYEGSQFSFDTYDIIFADKNSGNVWLSYENGFESPILLYTFENGVKPVAMGQDMNDELMFFTDDGKIYVFALKGAD